MRKVLKGVAIFLILGNPLFAQKSLDIEFSNEFEFSKPSELSYLINLPDGSFAALFTKGKNSMLRTFSDNMELLNEIPLDDKIKKSKSITLDVFEVGGRIYRIATTSQYLNPDQSFTNVYLQEIDIKTLTLKEAVSLGKTTSTFDSWDYEIIESKSKDFFGVVINARNDSQSGQIVNIFDNNFNLSWRNVFYISKVRLGKNYYYEDELKIPLMQFLLTDEAKLFALISSEDGLKINSLETDGSFNTVTQSTQDKIIHDAKLIDDSDNSLSLVGFYSNSKSSDLGGLYYQKINYDLSMDEPKLYDLGPEYFYDEDFGEQEELEKVDRKVEKDKKIRVMGYMIEDVLLEDNQLYVIGERRDLITKSYYSPNGSYSVTYTFFRDVLVLKLNENGEVLWDVKIAKRQDSARGSKHSSILILKDMDRISIIYNDQKSNSKNDGEKESMSNFRNMNLISVNIDKIGSSVKTVLFESQEKDVRLMPKTGIMINRSSVIMYGIIESKNSFVKLK